MKPKRKVEETIRRKLRFTAATTLHDRLLAEVMNAQEELTRIGPTLHEPVTRRTIMRSPIAKLTSLAAVIAVAVLSLLFWTRLSTPAYAIEETIEALQNIKFLHIVGRDETGQINDERWIEVGANGYQVRYRQENPAPHYFGVIEDGKFTAVYRHDEKAAILYDRKDKQFQWVGPLGKVFENLRQEGKLLKENDEYQGRRVHKVWWPALSSECYIDPQTKLPIAVGNTEFSYEEPPAGTFEIVIPDGYAVLDKRPGAPAIAVPDWLQQEDDTQENKEECFRQGRLALIRGDYAEAVKQFEQAIGCDSWAWFWLGKAYYELGQYDRAIKNFDTLFDTFKKIGGGNTIPFCQYARGLAYARLGMQEQAKADLQACLPAMIETLRTPSGGSMFEYADSPMIRSGQYQPGERELVVKMINRLRLITGQNFGYDPALTNEQNEAAVAAWERWFKGGGQVRFTPGAEMLDVPAEWVIRLGWGRKSNQEIAAGYTRGWLNQISEPGALLKVGFALYDAGRYDEALAVFEKMEARAEDNPRRQAMALTWQGHMLDLLGRRDEAVAKYRVVESMGLESGVQHDQYGLSYEYSPYARERMATPFTRVENMDDD